MPSTVRGMHGRMRPDIVLGDRYGTSCASELTDLIAGTLSGMGYSVSRNKPYAGGFITEHYGQPSRGLHALQLEFNRNLYMDEKTLAKTGRFARLSADLAKLVGVLTAAFDDGFLSRRDAAE
jgi:N-formylglutamate amidohydrolase